MRVLLTILACLLLASFVHADWLAKTMAVGIQPAAVAVNPATDHIFVANRGSGTVTVIHGGTDSVTTVSVGLEPASLAVDPVTDRTYVANYAGASVTVIEGDGSSATEVPTDEGPCAIAVNPVMNRIYVANYRSGSVTVIDGASLDTTFVPVGVHPRALAVNPVTGRIYVANYDENTVSVIDSTNNVVARVSTGNSPVALTANPATNKVYVANLAGNSVTVIDGATNNTIQVTVGTHPVAIAADPTSNRIYVANAWSNDLTAIDGATNNTLTITAGRSPCAVAVNATTGKVYVACQMDSSLVIVLDSTGRTERVSTVPEGLTSVAVDPITNRTYPVSRGAGLVCFVNGADYDTTSIGTDTNAIRLAVNPVNNKIYVVNNATHRVTIIDGNNDDTSTVSAWQYPLPVAVNPVTGSAYVGTSMYLYMIDGVSNQVAWQIQLHGGSRSLALNPVSNQVCVGTDASSVVLLNGTTRDTAILPIPGGHVEDLAWDLDRNKIYAFGGDGVVNVIDADTRQIRRVPTGHPAGIAIAVNEPVCKAYALNLYVDSVTIIDLNGVSPNVKVAVGNDPCALAVNRITKRVYVANSSSNDVTVIDGVTNQTTTVRVGDQPRAIAVNPISNTVYVTHPTRGTVTVIDGITYRTVTIPVGSRPSALAANPVTGKVYLADPDGRRVTVLEESKVRDTRVRARFALACSTEEAQPLVNGEAVNRWTPDRTRLEGVLLRTLHGAPGWCWASVLSGQGSDSIQWAWCWGSDSLKWGENYLCAVPLESDAATTSNLGLGTPFAGNALVRPIYRIQPYVGLQEDCHASPSSGQPELQLAAAVLRDRLEIQYAVTQSGPVSLKVYDLAGRTVKTLVSAQHKPGRYNLTWNRTDDRGRRLPGGIYFIRLCSPSSKKTSKVVAAE